MVKIRPASSADCVGMLEIYGPIIEHSPASFELVIPTIEEFQTRVAAIQKTHAWFVCEWDNQIAGYAYAGTHRSRSAYQWSVELSVYIHPSFQRRGIGKALYTALVSMLKYQGFYTALAGISLPNQTSVEFHESFGFTPVGIYHNIGFKFEQWQHVGWWEYPINSYLYAPSEILPMEQVVTMEAWTADLESAEQLIKSID